VPGGWRDDQEPRCHRGRRARAFRPSPWGPVIAERPPRTETFARSGCAKGRPEDAPHTAGVSAGRTVGGLLGGSQSLARPAGPKPPESGPRGALRTPEPVRTMVWGTSPTWLENAEETSDATPRHPALGRAKRSGLTMPARVSGLSRTSARHRGHGVCGPGARGAGILGKPSRLLATRDVEVVRGLPYSGHQGVAAHCSGGRSVAPRPLLRSGRGAGLQEFPALLNSSVGD
jgi:hypothetical protein